MPNDDISVSAEPTLLFPISFEAEGRETPIATIHADGRIDGDAKDMATWLGSQLTGGGNSGNVLFAIGWLIMKELERAEQNRETGEG